MPDHPYQMRVKTGERLFNRLIELLRRAGVRGFSNAILRLIRFRRRHEPIPPGAPAAPRPAPGPATVPRGPFVTRAAPDTPALLVFVPRSLRSRLIDDATGGYGYSHLAVDCGEVDEPTGRRVMIESVPGQPVGRSFQDIYGRRPFVRVSLARAGFDTGAFCAAVQTKLGEHYDDLEALTWGEVDDPAKQICSDLAAVALPRGVLEDIARQYLAGRLPRRSVSPHHYGTPEFHAFVSPNAFAAYFGAPPGERLRGPDQHYAAGPSSGRGRPRRPRRAKLIYNPAAGAGWPLAEIVAELQSLDILPEVYLVASGAPLGAVVADAVRRGIRLIIVAGGDGTVDGVMGALVGTRATLGIIPCGTRNNIAYSLGIPVGNLAAAAALLRAGQRLKVDVGRAYCGGARRWFLEGGAIGLASVLYPAADAVQHGDLARAADLLSAFVTAAPGVLSLELDGSRTVVVENGHMAVFANMPYIGARFHLAPDIAFDDGRLDILVFGRMSKLELLAYAVQAGGGTPGDPRVAHYQARRARIVARPAMTAMVDGVTLGDSPLRVWVRRRGLAVMAGSVLPPPGMPVPAVDAMPVGQGDGAREGTPPEQHEPRRAGAA